ncbi:replication protein [Marinicellulosiphila megalodicopiae]|uniref:replication protein n=1 Tax=Marinicellulosiphila megalodicopiae TaxID=2724896 RepID=UPI003BB03627
MSQLPSTNNVVPFPRPNQNVQSSERGTVVEANIENGFLRLANQLLEQLAKTKLNGYERRIIDAVMLKTFRFHQKTDWISDSQLSEITNIARSHVCRSRLELIKRKILLKDGKKIGINPVISEWKETEKPKSNCTKSGTNINKKGCTESGTNLYQERYSPIPEMVQKSTESGTHNKKKLNNKKIKDICTLNQNLENIPEKKKRQVTPELFKEFFNQYPEHRRGGNYQQAWKTWKSEKLEESEIQLAVDWLKRAAVLDSQWQTNGNGQYVVGITKFIREYRWRIPYIPMNSNPSISGNPQREEVRQQLRNIDDTSWADDYSHQETFDQTPAYQDQPIEGEWLHDD